MIASRCDCGPQLADRRPLATTRSGFGRLDRVRHLVVAADAAAARELHAVLDHEAFRERLDRDVDAVAVVGRPDREVGRLPVDQHRVGQHVVGAPELAVEILGPLVGCGEARLVDDDVALDHAQPRLPQVVHEAPPALDREQRVAAALQVEVSLEHALDDRRVRQGARLPGIGRPEQVERGPGRQHLHRRGGRARHRGIELEQVVAGRDVAHDDADARFRARRAASAPRAWRAAGRPRGAEAARLAPSTRDANRILIWCNTNVHGCNLQGPAQSERCSETFIPEHP